MKTNVSGFAIAAIFAAITTAAQQPSAHRAPAVPLITNDPYFSVWSMSDKLADSATKHWSEAPQPLTGLIRIDGNTFRWMGTGPRSESQAPPPEAMKQDSVTVTPLHTRYVFSAAGIELHVTFFTPLFPKDLDVLSRPVTYLTWNARSTDAKTHHVDLLLDVDPMIAVNEPAQPVTWSRSRVGKLTVLSVGSRDQALLHQSGDRIRIDWGYFRLAIPADAIAETAMSKDSLATFVANGSLPDSDDLAMPQPANVHHAAAHLDTLIPLGDVGADPVERHVLLAYTQDFAIQYLDRNLRPYWARNGMTQSAMLQAAAADYATLDNRANRFDEDLTRDMNHAGGADYAYITALAFRHTIAAHALVADLDGQPMLFSKENDSNGCIDTVDVTYPSSPFFLLFNPKLLQAQLEPVMRYAALPRWRFPFAPHDLGTFPLANGQVYGGGELTADNQMPVEESGNLLLMIAALGKAERNWDFARRYMPQLTAWAAYLETKGMDPENQLSTDDFAGHLAHNTNLSLKAIEALGAFAQIAHGVGDEALAKRYETTAKSMVPRWLSMAKEGDHYKLAFDQPNTWSQKYNLIWDNILGLHLFPPSLVQTEWTFYAQHENEFGLPLDNRKSITKLDWEFWTASLSTDPAQFTTLAHTIAHWTDATTSRVPLTDFYDTISGKQMGFQARSVVGGIFVKALMDPELARKWGASAH